MNFSVVNEHRFKSNMPTMSTYDSCTKIAQVAQDPSLLNKDLFSWGQSRNNSNNVTSGTQDTLPELSNAPRAAGTLDMSTSHAMDPAMATLGAETREGLDSVEQSKREIARRHHELQIRRESQIQTAASLAGQTLGTHEVNTSSVQPRHASGPLYGVVTVFNRQRPPFYPEPGFVLEGSFPTKQAAQQYVEKAVQNKDHVGNPMIIEMQKFEFLAVSLDRQVDVSLRTPKIERLLGRYYLDQEMKKREHVQNVMQKKAGQVGLSKEFKTIVQTSARQKKEQERLRKKVQKQLHTRKALIEAARREQETLSGRIEILDDDDECNGDFSKNTDADEQTTNQIRDATTNKGDAELAKPLQGSVNHDTAEGGASVSDDEKDAQEHEEQVSTFVDEVTKLGGKTAVQFSFPAALKQEDQQFAVVGIVPDTDTKLNDTNTEAPGNEPLLNWYGTFATEKEAQKFIHEDIPNLCDLDAVDLVPLYLPLYPNSVNVEEIEEHYRDPEQDKVSKFRKSQKNARAKFDELCEGVDVPVVDLSAIDVSPLDVEKKWRDECREAEENGFEKPLLPRMLVEVYASKFMKAEGVIPEDIKVALLEDRVQKPCV